MDSRECIPFGGTSLQCETPLSSLNHVDMLARSLKDMEAIGHEIKTGMNIDLIEVYFLIMLFCFYHLAQPRELLESSEVNL